MLQLPLLQLSTLAPRHPRQRSPIAVEADAWCRTVVHHAVSAAFAVSAAELSKATRGAAPVAFARQSAMYLAHVAFGLTFSQVGRAFGRDRTTAAHACRRVEECREDPRLDATLAALEDALSETVPHNLAVRP